MDILDKSTDRVVLRFTQAELQKISDPILDHAEAFTSSTLDLANILKEQAYRMKNTFQQPPHAFGN
ncbi:MAG: hypothetical protein M0Z44_05080 [Gammaproteobacteria bacterium]|nr:hypothetical protein [Gammaproteobacteria bacterium]